MFLFPIRPHCRDTKTEKSVPNEHRKVLNDYLALQVCAGLEEAGIFGELRNGVDIRTLFDKYGVSGNRVRAAIEFLWVATDWVEKNGAVFRLKSNAPINDFVNFVMAYKDVFDNIGPLIKREKIYGKDVVRRGEYLARASVGVAWMRMRQALDTLGEDEPYQLVDLGCGSAQSLAYFCGKNKTSLGLGIDNDVRAVREARSNVEDKRLADRIEIVNADAQNVQTLAQLMRTRQGAVFLASMILHEFLRDGREALIDFLRNLSSSFPRARFFILEFDAPSYDVLKQENDTGRKLFMAQYKLFHPFTDQGDPLPVREWAELITASGWHIQNINAKQPLVIYDCRN